jgi:hypothetical protein
MVKQILIFIFVSIAWIFFRAETVSDACLILKRIFTTGWSDPKFPILGLILCFGIWIYQFVYESRFRWILEKGSVRIIGVVGMIIYLILFARSDYQPFIYFQF